MGDVINLNQARKRRARAEAEREAAQNRVKFGRSKAQKQQDAAAAEEARRRLDLLKRDAPADPEEPGTGD